MLNANLPTGVNPPAGLTAVVSPASSAVAGAYTTGQSVGGLITLTNAARTQSGTGLIQSVTFSTMELSTIAFDIVFFSAQPAATFTDKTTPALSLADGAKVIGVAHITDYTQFSASTLYQAQNLSIPFATAGGGSGKDLYALIIARGSITLASGDIALQVRLFQD